MADIVKKYVDLNGLQQYNSGVEGKYTPLSELQKYNTSFVGTTGEWASLSSTEKAKYQIVCFTDDTNNNGEGGLVIRGYYYPANDKFYKESAHTTEIPGATGYVYYDIATYRLFTYDSTNVRYLEYSANVLVADITSVSGVQCYKNGVNIQLTFSGCEAASIPAGYRPGSAKYLGLVFDDTSKAPVLVYAGTEGSVAVQEMSTANVLSSYKLYGTLTFMY